MSQQPAPGGIAINHSDASIGAAAQNALAWASSVPYDALEVAVSGGRISLSGSVDWKYQKQAAVQAVRFLAGVQGVNDLIVLKPRLPAGAIKVHIETALREQTALDARHIEVRVDGPDVTLTGTVGSFAEREMATDTAWGTPGIRNVVDELTFTG